MSTRLSTLFENNGLFLSKDDEEPKKTPKGFEKFLKKTREGKKNEQERQRSHVGKFARD